MTLFKVAPTDLTYLWDECPRCFWLKQHNIRKRPSAPFPSIFGKIDRLQRETFKDFIFPNGDKMDTSNRTVTSSPLTDSTENNLIISGRMDCLIIHPDNGLVTIMDFKTSEVSEEGLEKYRRQLHAYAWCLEHPQKNGIMRVAGLRLFYSTPDHYVHSMGLDDSFALGGRIGFHELTYDATWFEQFLNMVLTLLSMPEPPASEKCEYCNWESNIIEAYKAKEKK